MNNDEVDELDQEEDDTQTERLLRTRGNRLLTLLLFLVVSLALCLFYIYDVQHTLISYHKMSFEVDSLKDQILSYERQIDEMANEKDGLLKNINELLSEIKKQNAEKVSLNEKINLSRDDLGKCEREMAAELDKCMKKESEKIQKLREEVALCEKKCASKTNNSGSTSSSSSSSSSSSDEHEHEHDPNNHNARKEDDYKKKNREEKNVDEDVDVDSPYCWLDGFFKTNVFGCTRPKPSGTHTAGPSNNASNSSHNNTNPNLSSAHSGGTGGFKQEPPPEPKICPFKSGEDALKYLKIHPFYTALQVCLSVCSFVICLLIRYMSVCLSVYYLPLTILIDILIIF